MRVIGVIALLIAALFMVKGLRALWIVYKIPSRPQLVRRYGGCITLKRKARKLALCSLILMLLGAALLL